MRLWKALPVVAALVAAAVPGSPAHAQELPEYTVEQRWERAALHVTLFAVIAIRQGIDAGTTAVDAGHTVARIFGPGWSGVRTPLAMARAIHFNWQLYPGSVITIQQAADGSVTLRMNRPYAAAFGENRMLYGVSLADFDTTFRVFHGLVAEQQGMEFRQTEDPEWISMVIRAR
jgi:hypothetical protein